MTMRPPTGIVLGIAMRDAGATDLIPITCGTIAITAAAVMAAAAVAAEVADAIVSNCASTASPRRRGAVRAASPLSEALAHLRENAGVPAPSAIA